MSHHFEEFGVNDLGQDISDFWDNIKFVNAESFISTFVFDFYFEKKISNIFLLFYHTYIDVLH